MKQLANKLSTTKVDLAAKEIKHYFNIICSIYVTTCLIIYMAKINKMVVSHQWIYGIFMYTLLLIDRAKECVVKNENGRKTDLLRRDDIIKAMLKTFTLLTVPVLTLNQSLMTRLPYYYMMACASVPGLYLILLLYARSQTTQDITFARCLTTSVVLNSFVSLKTTYYGLMACIALLFNQYYQNRGCFYREMISTMLTISFIDFTLSALAVYK